MKPLNEIEVSGEDAVTDAEDARRDRQLDDMQQVYTNAVSSKAEASSGPRSHSR